MRRLSLLSFLVLLLLLLCSLSNQLWSVRYRMQAEIPAGYVIPSQYSRVLSLGNHGLLADFLFLKLVAFFGGRSIAGQALGVEEWNYLGTGLDVVTDLDPYFLDPYFLAEGLLAWDAGQVEKANEILLKGITHRPKEWVLPFFVGFNHFYFLKDYAVASDYIMAASRLPGSPSYLQALASRLAYYGGKSKTALLFLQEMIAEADDPLLRKRLSKRLEALRHAVIIEEAMEKFKVREGRLPHRVAEIVERGYLTQLPEDPYGGAWGILENGRVFSTSRFAEPPPKESEKEAGEGRQMSRKGTSVR